MRLSVSPLLLLLAPACGNHEAGEPTARPIPAVTTDAVYVVNGADASLSVIDAASSAVVGVIELEGASYPHHLSFSSDGRDLYLAIPGVDLSGGHGGGGHDDSTHAFVMRLDAATGDTLAVASLDGSNHNAIAAPDGTAVWTSQMTEPGRVLTLDPVTLDVEAEVEVEAMPAEVTFSADGATAFVANGGSDSVSAIDTTSLEVRATIGVGDNPVGAWPGRDGRLYVDNEAGKSITTIEPDRLEAGMIYQLAFTPAYATTIGETLWVTDTDAGRVVLLDLATGEPIDEIATGAGAHAIAVSPDGARAWVTNQGADTVSVIDTAARMIVATVAVGQAPNGLAFRQAP